MMLKSLPQKQRHWVVFLLIQVLCCMCDGIAEKQLSSFSRQLTFQSASLRLFRFPSLRTSRTPSFCAPREEILQSMHPSRRNYATIKCSFDNNEDDLDSQVMDWRSFRAKLVKSEQQGQAQNDVAKAGRGEAVQEDDELWLHELAVPEPGCLLIANPSKFQTSQNYFRHAVILLAEHGEEGSVGFIHNRPTPWEVGDIAPTLSVFARCPVCFGGPVGDGLQFVHRIPDIPRSVPLMDGVFLGGDIEAAAEAVRKGNASLDDVRFFYKYCSWAPGQLVKELEDSMVGGAVGAREPVWYQAACSNAVLFYPRGTAFVRTHTDASEWRAALQMMPARFGARYPEIHQTPRDAFPPGALVSSWMRILSDDNRREECVERGLALIGACVIGPRVGSIANPSERGVGKVEDRVSETGESERVAAMLDAMAAHVHARTEELEQARRMEEDEEAEGGALLRALSEVLISQLRFTTETPQDLSPDSFLISQVLERRQGSALVLAIVVQALARRLGVQVSLALLEGQELLSADAAADPSPRNPSGRRVAHAWPLKRVGLREGKYYVRLLVQQGQCPAAPKKAYLIDMNRQGKVVSEASALKRYLEKAGAGLPKAEHTGQQRSLLLRPNPPIKVLSRVLHQLISVCRSGPYANSLHTFQCREMLETLEEAAARLRMDRAA